VSAFAKKLVASVGPVMFCDERERRKSPWLPRLVESEQYMSAVIYSVVTHVKSDREWKGWEILPEFKWTRRQGKRRTDMVFLPKGTAERLGQLPQEKQERRITKEAFLVEAKVVRTLDWRDRWTSAIKDLKGGLAEDGEVRKPSPDFLIAAVILDPESSGRTDGRKQFEAIKDLPFPSYLHNKGSTGEKSPEKCCHFSASGGVQALRLLAKYPTGGQAKTIARHRKGQMEALLIACSL